MLGFIDSPVQLIIAAVVILIVFGPQKLPEIMGQIGRGLRDLKKAGAELTKSIHLDDEPVSEYKPYNTDYTYSATETAILPEEHRPALTANVPVDNGWHGAVATQEPMYGDFAAAALSDTGEEYGVMPTPAPSKPGSLAKPETVAEAKPELTVSSPQGETIAREK